MVGLAAAGAVVAAVVGAVVAAVVGFAAAGAVVGAVVAAVVGFAAAGAVVGAVVAAVVGLAAGAVVGAAAGGLVGAACCAGWQAASNRKPLLSTAAAVRDGDIGKVKPPGGGEVSAAYHAELSPSPSGRGLG